MSGKEGPSRSKHSHDPSGDALREPNFIRYWLMYFSSAVGITALLLGVGLFILKSQGLLPAPPLVATACIDEKLAFLRKQDLGEMTFMAVGSSATWRNLDMTPFQTDDTRAINAAPCYLYVHETAYFTKLLLDISPSVDTVLVVLAPRDFDACPASQAAFMNTWLAKQYIARRVPYWLPYLVNPRISYLITEAQTRTKSNRGLNPQSSLEMDAYGSSLMLGPAPWRPKPIIDAECFDVLRGLSVFLDEADIKFIVATIPVMPEWRDQFDRDGLIYKAWTQDIRQNLVGDAMFLDGSDIDWGDEAFADPVHLMPDYARHYSDMIAERVNNAGAD